MPGFESCEGSNQSNTQGQPPVEGYGSEQKGCMGSNVPVGIQGQPLKQESGTQQQGLEPSLNRVSSLLVSNLMPEYVRKPVSLLIKECFPPGFTHYLTDACQKSQRIEGIIGELFGENFWDFMRDKEISFGESSEKSSEESSEESQEESSIVVPYEEHLSGIQELEEHSKRVNYLSEKIARSLFSSGIFLLKPYEGFNPGDIHDVGKLAPGVLRCLVCDECDEIDEPDENKRKGVLKKAQNLHVIIGAGVVVKHYMLYHKLSDEDLENRDISQLSYPLATVLIHHLFTNNYPQINELPEFPDPVRNLISQIYQTAEIFIKNKNESIIKSIEEAKNSGLDLNIISAVMWALVVCAADLYTSLKEPRKYRENMLTHDEAMKIVNETFNNQSFPDVYKALVEAISLIPSDSEYSYLREPANP